MTVTTHANIVCSRCKRGFTCGLIAGDDTCWCFYFPRMKPIPIKDLSTECGCLCPNCLEESILLGQDDDFGDPTY